MQLGYYKREKIYFIKYNSRISNLKYCKLPVDKNSRANSVCINKADCPAIIIINKLVKIKLLSILKYNYG